MYDRMNGLNGIGGEINAEHKVSQEARTRYICQNPAEQDV
jgi:hypothetical protein